MDEGISDEELEGKVVDLLAGIDVAIEPERDIQACHRYGKKNAVIVKFSNRKVVAKIMSVKSNLEGNIFINESLCPKNKNFRTKCNLLKKAGLISKVGTRNGMVRVKLLGSENYTNVNHDDFFTEKFPDFEFPF